jgi:hypothetical protein
MLRARARRCASRSRAALRCRNNGTAVSGRMIRRAVAAAHHRVALQRVAQMIRRATSCLRDVALEQADRDSVALGVGPGHGLESGGGQPEQQPASAGHRQQGCAIAADGCDPRPAQRRRATAAGSRQVQPPTGASRRAGCRAPASSRFEPGKAGEQPAAHPLESAIQARREDEKPAYAGAVDARGKCHRAGGEQGKIGAEQQGHPGCKQAQASRRSRAGSHRPRTPRPGNAPGRRRNRA